MEEVSSNCVTKNRTDLGEMGQALTNCRQKWSGVTKRPDIKNTTPTKTASAAVPSVPPHECVFCYVSLTVATRELRVWDDPSLSGLDQGGTLGQEGSVAPLWWGVGSVRAVPERGRVAVVLSPGRSTERLLGGCLVLSPPPFE